MSSLSDANVSASPTPWYQAPFAPLLETIQGYNGKKFGRDLVAGLTVAVVAIPQCMAFASIAGVDNNLLYVGLYSVIIHGLISSLFTSSSHLSTGPTNTLSLLTASVVTSVVAHMQGGVSAEEYVGLLSLLSLMAGLLQIVFGIARMGALFRYVSHSVIVGFTAGAGLLIIAKQLPKFLGLPSPADPTHWPGVIGIGADLWLVLPHANLDTILRTAVVGIITLVVMISIKRVNNMLPGPLIAVFIASLTVVLAGWTGGDLVPLVGEMPSRLPMPTLPPLNFGWMQALLAGAVAIALESTIESMSIGKAIGMRSGERIQPSREFFALGLANCASCFFGGFPGTGSFSRSALNYSAGAATRFSNAVNSVAVLVALLLFGWASAYLPTTSLAAILFVVAFGLIDWQYVMRLARTDRGDLSVCLATLFATLLVPLEYAIFMGIFINIAVYLRKASRLHMSEMVRSSGGPFEERPLKERSGQRRVMFLQVEGDLFFGHADELHTKLSELLSKPVRVVIFRLKRTHSIDSTVLEVFDDFTRQLKEKGGHVVVCGIQRELKEMLEAYGVAKTIGQENIFETSYGLFTSAKRAMARARELVGGSIDVTGIDLNEDETEGWAYQI